MRKIVLFFAVLLLGASTVTAQWGKGMLVKAGTTVTEESGTTIYIHGGAGWTLLLEDDLNHNPSMMVSGVVKVDAGSDSVRFQQYITKDAWHYVSAPVTPSRSHDFLWMYLYKFNENTRDWTNIFNDNAQALTMGRGYAVWSPTNGGIWPAAGDSMEYHGLPINTSIDNYALSYAYSGTAAQKGWNLVGNPFTVALDWNGDAAWDLQNVDATIYEVDQDAFATGNGYQTYNWSTGLGTNGGDSIISSGQGFFVHANAAGARMDFPVSQRFHRPSKDLVKGASSVNDPANLLRIKLSNEKGQNEMFIAFNPNTVEGNDPLFDALHIELTSSIGEIYAAEGDAHYVQYWNPSIENHEVVPVNFEAHSNGVYSLTFSNIEGFDASIPIWLEDVKTNEWQDLRENAHYSFAATTDDDAARFRVHFAAPNNVEEFTDNSFANIYAYEKDIHIVTPADFSGQVYVYDLLGKEILTKNIQGESNVIPMDYQDTYFLVKLVGDDKVVTKKLYIH